ncbi:MAG: putative 2-aminoethylphosphonate ABC transporter substrate-binding protein [Sarcina sp.]
MKRFLKLVTSALIVATTLTGCISTKPQYIQGKDKTLTIYSALEEEQINEYISDFREMYPEIKVNIIMDSHGVISAKLVSENENPQADVIWGLSAINMIDLEDRNLLKPYKSKTFEEVNKKFIDDGEVPNWTGLTVTETAFVVNHKELEKLNLKVPESFEDLIKPEYKGLITMPNPASSGTGYFTVAAILQMMGEEKGWDYLGKLHENMGMYTHSGSKPAKLAASGEYPIGISFGYRATKQMNNGDPVVAVFPTEGSGWDLESIALTNKSEIKEESKIFMEWALSKETMKLYSNNAAVTSIVTDVEPPKGYPEKPLEQLIDNDITWSSKNRLEILKEWEKNYGAKTESK